MTGGAAPTEADFHDAVTHRGDRWYGACLRITRSPQLAEDAVQEALLSAWSKRDQFNHASRLETWIHRIAVNAALMQLRKSKPGVFEPLQFDVEDDSTSPESARQTDDMERDLASALDHLSDVERTCFILKHLEEWRLAEIADELDTNVGTVKQALFRGVRKLRDRMPSLRSVNP